jgi:hypothetical protein
MSARHLIALACAIAAQASAQTIPASLAPAGESVTLSVAAKGVQIYECRARKDASGVEWAFVAPEADLLTDDGGKFGTHGAGPAWQANDGSRIEGKAAQRADAPVAGAIPWLLLTTRSTGGNGVLSEVTSVQRVNTAGGIAPAGDCTPGATARVAYTADYRFLRRQ